MKHFASCWRWTLLLQKRSPHTGRETVRRKLFLIFVHSGSEIPFFTEMTGTILNRCVPAYCPDVRVKWEISGILTYASLIVYDHLEQKIIILTVVNKHSGNRCQRKKAKEKIKSTNNDIIAVYCVRAKHKILCLNDALLSQNSFCSL